MKSLRIHNTLTGKKEEVVPLQDDNHIRMYVCGVTVYDFPHIGHARGAVLFDLLKRLLVHLGFNVTYVRNITDIDDKIIKRSRDEKVSWKHIAHTYAHAFREDMKRLRVDSPDHEPMATDYIPEMIEFIRRLEQSGMAYESNGDVYFSIEKFPDYGKLSGKPLEDLVAGTRVEVSASKRNPLDFVLWKKSGEDDPGWDSPWGKGRPGWHIECSVMSTQLLGPSFEIHGGGCDLIFPHHENEIAQSEALFGKQFAKFWIHNAFVTIDKEKMSKSLGNFFTIRQALERWSPEAIRHFILQTSWSHPLNFSEESLDASRKAVNRISETFDRISRFCPDMSGISSPHFDEFIDALCDDLNSARAMGVLFETITEINRLCDNRTEGDKIMPLAVSFKKMLSLFRLLPEKDNPVSEEILALIRERETARREKDFQRADEIRNILDARGILLKDTPTGTHWYRK